MSLVTQLKQVCFLALFITLTPDVQAQEEGATKKRNTTHKEDAEFLNRVYFRSNTGLANPIGNLGFQLGVDSIVFTAGLQKNFGQKDKLPLVNFCFQDRFPKLTGKIPHVRLFDNFSASVNLSLSKPSTMDLAQYGVAYLLNTSTDKLLGYQAFQLPSISDMFKLSTAQGAVTLNLLRNRPGEGWRKGSTSKILWVGSIDWTVTGTYTPVKVEGTMDHIAEDLAKIAKEIEGLTNSLSNPLVELTSGDSIRRDIKRLTNIASSIKEIPQTVIFDNLKQDYISKIYNDNENDVNKKGKPIIVAYTGPSVTLCMRLPNTKSFFLSGYAQYLWPISTPKANKEIYVVEEKSELDTAKNYRRLLSKVGIDVEENPKELTKTDPFKSNLFAFGGQLSMEFHAINLFIGFQGIKQLSKPEYEGQDFNTTDRFTSSFSVGGNINLINVFRPLGGK